jgi:hypothetical protein
MGHDVLHIQELPLVGLKPLHKSLVIQKFCEDVKLNVLFQSYDVRVTKPVMTMGQRDGM